MSTELIEATIPKLQSLVKKIKILILKFLMSSFSLPIAILNSLGYRVHLCISSITSGGVSSIRVGPRGRTIKHIFLFLYTGGVHRQMNEERDMGENIQGRTYILSVRGIEQCSWWALNSSIPAQHIDKQRVHAYLVVCFGKGGSRFQQTFGSAHPLK